MSRQKIDRIHFIEGALGVDIKGAQAVDFIIKEINPERQFAAHRKQIQQCAANGKLAVLQYLFDTTVAALNQLFTQLIPRQLFPFGHHQRMTGEKFRRTHFLHQCIDRQNQCAFFEGRQTV